MGGFLNRAYSCFLNDDLNLQKAGLFIRINGPNRKAVERLFIHKDREIRYLQKLNEHEVGPPLYATFNNGLVMKFMKGNMVSAEQLKNPDLETKAAQILAKIHLTNIPDHMPKHWGMKEGVHRLLNELSQSSNLDERFKADFNRLVKEYECITNWINSCEIPIQLNHGDFDPKNMLYDEETGVLTAIDYECINTQVFTHDLATYFTGYLGLPFDFTKYDGARMKQFVRLYLEAKYDLQQKPRSELTENELEKVFYWAELSYTFLVLMFAVWAGWFKSHLDFSETPLSPETDWYAVYTEPCMREYFRMKEKLTNEQRRFSEKLHGENNQ